MKKIVIIEDSRIVSELLKFDLEAHFDCEVHCFSDSKEFFSNIDSHPDVIILDYYIGDSTIENGLDVLKKIKAINKNIPIIIFSGQSQLKLAIDLIHAGAVDYIDKNEDTFLEDINNAIKNIFDFNAMTTELNAIETAVKLESRQFIGWSIFATLLLLTLFSI